MSSNFNISNNYTNVQNTSYIGNVPVGTEAHINSDNLSKKIKQDKGPLSSGAYTDGLKTLVKAGVIPQKEANEFLGRLFTREKRETSEIELYPKSYYENEERTKENNKKAANEAKILEDKKQEEIANKKKEIKSQFERFSCFNSVQDITTQLQDLGFENINIKADFPNRYIMPHADYVYYKVVAHKDGVRVEKVFSVCLASTTSTEAVQTTTDNPPWKFWKWKFWGGWGGWGGAAKLFRL